jgi:K+-transporting ATPase ATPase C chain
MRKQILPAIVMVVLMTVLVGGVYPLVVTGVSQLAFQDRASGSFVEVDGSVVGSELIGQSFEGDEYFWPRPSAAGDGYDPLASSGSNLGPTNPALIGECEPVPVTDDEGNDVVDEAGNTVYETDAQGVQVCDPDTVPQRADAYRKANDIPDGTEVPVDAVTSSASGLDPHISVLNARLQAPRVAAARDLEVDTVLGLITDNTDPAILGILGVDGVNVLKLNIALDQQR